MRESSSLHLSQAEIAQVRSQHFEKARKLLHDQNVPFDPDILLTQEWKQTLAPVFSQMPEMQTVRHHTGPLMGAVFADTLYLPEQIELADDTIILARQVIFTNQNVVIKGPHSIYFYRTEILTGHEQRPRTHIVIDTSGIGRKEWLEKKRQQMSPSVSQLSINSSNGERSKQDVRATRRGKSFNLLSPEQTNFSLTPLALGTFRQGCCADGSNGADGDSGEHGTNGTAGGAGTAGTPGSCGNIINGLAGGDGVIGGNAMDGGSGTNGGNGGNAGDIYAVVYEWDSTSFSAVGGDGGNGGNGGTGGIGGDGGSGGGGGDGADCTCVQGGSGSGGTGGKGKNGGLGASGGNGGNGGTAGNGGFIQVTFWYTTCDTSNFVYGGGHGGIGGTGGAWSIGGAGGAGGVGGTGATDS